MKKSKKITLAVLSGVIILICAIFGSNLIVNANNYSPIDKQDDYYYLTKVFAPEIRYPMASAEKPFLNFSKYMCAFDIGVFGEKSSSQYTYTTYDFAISKSKIPNEMKDIFGKNAPLKIQDCNPDQTLWNNIEQTGCYIAYFKIKDMPYYDSIHFNNDLFEKYDMGGSPLWLGYKIDGVDVILGMEKNFLWGNANIPFYIKNFILPMKRRLNFYSQFNAFNGINQLDLEKIAETQPEKTQAAVLFVYGNSSDILKYKSNTELQLFYLRKTK